MKNNPTRYKLCPQSASINMPLRILRLFTHAQVLMAASNISYVVAASVLKYPVNVPTKWPLC